MNPLVGVAPNQVNLNDPKISDYAKFEAAKDELAFCQSLIRINQDNKESVLKTQKRATELIEYLQSNQKENKACYIATMAYGSYDHPQVKKLRIFRDSTLSKTKFGTWLITKYYFYSPKLVRHLKNRTSINFMIRKVLNQIIKLIG